MSGADSFRSSESNGETARANMGAALQVIEACWGDAAMLCRLLPRPGNAAISGWPPTKQLERLGRVLAAMAITEPGSGPTGGGATTAKLDGDEYVINGEKIFVTAGSRLPTSWSGRRWTSHWADRRSSRSLFPASTPVSLSSDCRRARVKGSDTAVIRFDDARIPEQVVGRPEIEGGKRVCRGDGDFDNARPLVAGMAIGIARASLEEWRKILTDVRRRDLL